MAGTGPAPKPAPERRRRNKTNEQTLPAEGYQGDYPKLPRSWRLERLTMVEDKKSGEKVPKIQAVNVQFLKGTREWYDTWARSPMAVEFTGVDWQRLQRVARLVDQYERNPTKELLAELRLQEAGFGGTPLDRRRLGRTIEPSKDTGQKPKSSTRTSGGRRARLTRVK